METLQIENDIIITTLENHKELYQQTLALIEKTFNYDKKNHYKVDFHLLMNPLNAQNNHILLDRRTKTLIGHIGVCLRTMAIGNFHTNVALLGGIAINPQHQKKGFMEKLIKKVIVQYQNKVSLFILWSNLDELYHKFDFFQINGQIQTGTKNIIGHKIAGFEKSNFSLLSNEEFLQIKYLYQKNLCQQYTTLLRNKQTWDLIKKIESTTLYLKKDKNNLIKGYFCVGKGQDLQNIIHELVYEAEDDNIIDQLSPFKLWLPQTKFDKKVSVSQLTYLGLFKIGNSDYFKKLISFWSNNKILIKNISKKEIQFLYEKNEYKRNPKDFLMDLFGFPPIKEFENFGKPIYISGLDSV